MLNAQLRTWLVTEMAVCARALAATPTRVVKRAEALGFLVAGAVIFGPREWEVHRREPVSSWVPTPMADHRRAAKRPGPSALQARVCEAIRSRTVKRRRLTVFDRRG
jgi:hypothetical protein